MYLPMPKKGIGLLLSLVWSYSESLCVLGWDIIPCPSTIQTYRQETTTDRIKTKIFAAEYDETATEKV